MPAGAAESFGAIFEPIFDAANFGYRRGRSTKDALRKVWKEIQAGDEWIVDADLKDFFGSVDHEKLLTLPTRTELSLPIAWQFPSSRTGAGTKP